MAGISGSAKVFVDRIIIEGRRIELRGVDIPVSTLELDSQNPRLANTVLGYSQSSDTDLQSFLEDTLWADPSVRDLAKQIQINKGLTERIIVTESGKVVEGNCRTVSYRKLHSQFPKDPVWLKIPARILPTNISRREIAILQGEMHVAGKITWSSFEKAGHVYRLHNEHMMTQDEIAYRLRMSKSKVNQLIRAFETMNVKYLRQYPEVASVHKFSYFEEFFKNPGLRIASSRDPSLVDRFVDWVGTGRLPEGKHVRDLPEILANAKAAKALDRGGYIAAMKVLEGDNPALTSTLFRSLQKATLELRDAASSDIDEVRNGNTAAIRLIDELSNALHNFRSVCGLDDTNES